MRATSSSATPSALVTSAGADDQPEELAEESA